MRFTYILTLAPMPLTTVQQEMASCKQEQGHMFSVACAKQIPHVHNIPRFYVCVSKMKK